MHESEIRKQSKLFAVEVLKLCDSIGNKGGRGALINQLVRSATSIGANAHEANYAASKADFINKLQISLKECYETEYWLDLFSSAQYFDERTSNYLSTCCGKIRRMLIKAINTSKES